MYPSPHLLLHPPFILHQWFRINLHVLHFPFLLLYQRGAGHAEDAVDVHSHFDLHFGAVSIWLRSNILDSKTSWGQIERSNLQNKNIHTPTARKHLALEFNSLTNTVFIFIIKYTLFQIYLICGCIFIITYSVIWVWKLLRVTVKGFKVKWFLFVKGDDLWKWSSVILSEHLTLSKKMEKSFSSGQKENLDIINISMLKCTDPTPSSVVDFQRRVIGKGTTSVMENSRTLNAGDKMAHCIRANRNYTNALFSFFFSVWIENRKRWSPGVHILGRQLHLHWGWCWCLCRKLGWFALWWPGFASLLQLSPPRRCHPGSALPKNQVKSFFRKPSNNKHPCIWPNFNDLLDCSRTAFKGASTLIRYWADISSKWPLWWKQLLCGPFIHIRGHF